MVHIQNFYNKITTSSNLRNNKGEGVLSWIADLPKI